MRSYTKTQMSVIVCLAFFVASCVARQTVSLPVSKTPSPQPTSTPIPTVVEPGLAYGIPCKPPCWRGLIPGKSTGEEAAQAIEQLRAEGWAGHITGGVVEGSYHVSPSPFTSDDTIDVIIEDNVVTQIRGSTLLFYYSIGNLVEQLGPPEWVYPTARTVEKCTCEEWRPPDEPMRNVPVYLLYPSQGMWFLALVPLNGLGCVCPEMKVTVFSYHAPYSVKEILEKEHPLVLQYATEQDILEWHGFGGY